MFRCTQQSSRTLTITYLLSFNLSGLEKGFEMFLPQWNSSLFVTAKVNWTINLWYLWVVMVKQVLLNFISCSLWCLYILRKCLPAYSGLSFAMVFRYCGHSDHSSGNYLNWFSWCHFVLNKLYLVFILACLCWLFTCIFKSDQCLIFRWGSIRTGIETNVWKSLLRIKIFIAGLTEKH